MSYTLEFSSTALKDLDQHKKSGNQPVLRKIEKWLKELVEQPLIAESRIHVSMKK